jgi:hypothetical protein
MKQLENYPKESQELYLNTLEVIPDKFTEYRHFKPIIDDKIDYYPNRNGAFKLLSDLVEMKLVEKETKKIGRDHYQHSYRRKVK